MGWEVLTASLCKERGLELLPPGSSPGAELSLCLPDVRRLQYELKQGSSLEPARMPVSRRASVCCTRLRSTLVVGEIWKGLGACARKLSHCPVTNSRCVSGFQFFIL